ncbi:MAG: hypothetical protein A2846_00675 [Candidatus Doudnabacteria bacterium RIFCSPHIGHO2_01_FULL_49_9]|uniref:Uncharacterized protein n=1 Tax=Candidatus Doudnabacteria bacterium RIFCSPHIGHO2_01_FULL_49_9 TaxID=1817827 RepID=A0A1F5NYU8_9BACT|nr:MAG: hypothetical protein A2846_00675 [Candidatus Doudnabacteria bacterium RIFCSPHIGHO2_01_FULL_49_9]
MKFSIFNFQFSKNSPEAGVTLIMAIVLLAAVSLTSFTLSSVILREVESAGLIQDSAPAIAGAYSGGEVGLYILQKNVGSIDLSNQSLSDGGASFDIISDLTDDPLLVTVVDTQNGYINLYDPENYEEQDTGIRSIEVTNNDGRPLKVEIFSWGDGGTAVCGTDNLPSGGTSASVLTCSGLIGPDYRYQIILDVNGTGTSNVSIRAFAADGSSIGSPSASPGFEATGRLGRVNHRIRVNLVE